MPTATMRRRALVVGEQHRDVLARAGGREDHRLDPERPHPLEPGRPTVAVGVHDDLGPAAQRVVGHRVHVADDEVGPVPRLDERVGAAVDADEDRLVLADVVAERLQVLLVVVAAHDDEGVPAVEVGADVGHADAVEEQLALLAQVVHGVLRRRPRAGRTGPARASVMASWTASLSRTVGASRPCGPSARTAPPSSVQLGAVLELHDVGAGPVEQRDAGGDEDLRARGSGSAPRSTTRR